MISELLVGVKFLSGTTLFLSINDLAVIVFAPVVCAHFLPKLTCLGSWLEKKLGSHCFSKKVNTCFSAFEKMEASGVVSFTAISRTVSPSTPTRDAWDTKYL